MNTSVSKKIENSVRGIRIRRQRETKKGKEGGKVKRWEKGRE